LEVKTFPEVLGATNVGFDAPLPKITLLAVRVARPVPPCATVTAALSVSIVAEALGKVKVFSVEAGPESLANPLPVPP
jgi:hypothetical protein